MGNLSDNFPSAWAEIRLDAIANNVRVLRGVLAPPAQLMAVVKANAYGHGAVPVARAALAAGATWLGVARAREGAELRAANIEAPILVLGPLAPSEAAEAVAARLAVSIGSLAAARALSQAAQAARDRTGTHAASHTPGERVAVHLKVDTGMSRFGVPLASAADAARALAGLPGLRLEGVFTHFAAADDADPSFSRLQAERFTGALDAIERAGVRVPLRHAANSAAILAAGAYHFDLVRAGIALYGICPAVGFDGCDALRPALSLKSRVALVRQIAAGTPVGYSRTFRAARDMCVALVSIGYADGVRRALSNRGAVLLRGKRAPILGRVSMDQIVVDADACGAEEGDEVVLIGRQDAEQISAEEVAAWAGTVSYEVLTGVSARVTRLYVTGDLAAPAVP